MWNAYRVNDVSGKYLFKFLSYENYQKFISTGDIWFSRADCFGDKMECITINDLKAKNLDIKQLSERKLQHLISCWHIGTKESLAMWDVYAKSESERKNVAIRFDKNYLILLICNSYVNISESSISKQIYGNIIYKNLIGVSQDKIKSKKVPHVSFRKEYAFKYEKEFRFVVKTKAPFSKVGIGINLGDVRNLNFSILINPLLDSSKYINIKNSIEESDFKNKLSESKLYRWLRPEEW